MIWHQDPRWFSHYPMKGGDLSAGPANVLADLTTWTVLENAATFTDLLS